MNVLKSQERIVLTLNDGTFFEDEWDHFHNAFLRLMRISEDEALGFFQLVSLKLSELTNYTYSNCIAILKQSWTEFRKMQFYYEVLEEDMCAIDTPLGRLPGSSIYKLPKNPMYAVVCDSERIHGRLVDSSTGSQIVESTSYEFDYFEGGSNSVGYGKLSKQDWRDEKAERIATYVAKEFYARNVKREQEVNVIDVGSGYGQFLKHLKKYDFRVKGIDISKHAAEIATAEYGIDTFVGSLEQFFLLKSGHEYWDVVTMWDYIEHPFDPISDLLQIHKHMSENGLLFIKTPNLDCPELEIFGADYHSLKLEHLHYFSKTSLVAALRKCGFVVDSVTTKSHLLKGFFGGIITTQSEKSHRGSDITVIARKV